MARYAGSAPQRNSRIVPLGVRGLSLVMVSLLLLSCASGSQPLSGEQITEYTETYGDGQFFSDPQRSTGNLSEIATINLVYEQLLTLDPKSLRPAPAAAALPQVLSDGLTYRFTLRTNLVYSDGSPVKASDYAYGVSRLCDPAVVAYYGAFFFPIVGCERWRSLDPLKDPPERLAAARRDLFARGIVVLSDRELEIRLREPAAYLPSLMTLWVTAPVRQSDVERSGEDLWFKDPATYVGNGPFVLSEWVLGSHLTFERNPRYRARARVDRWTIRFMSAQVAVAEYKANRLDRVAIGANLVAAASAAGLSGDLSITPGACTSYIRLNHTRPPLDDPKVRLALAKSIDRAALLKELHPNAAIPASFIPPGLPGHDPADKAQADDLTAARRLLGESRYVGTDALRMVWQLRNGFATSISRSDAEWITKRWREALGIDIRFEIIPDLAWAEAYRTMATRPLFERFGWCADYPDQQDWLSAFFPSKVQVAFNDFGYRNSNVDTLLAAADREGDQRQRDDLYMQASKIVSADVAFIYLFYAERASLRKPWVDGLNISVLDVGGIYHPGEVFIRPH